MRKETIVEDDLEIKKALEKVKNRLLVFSGKGGVGKSTVAANLAIALSQKGFKVGLMDVDLHGPDLALMLGVADKRMNVTDGYLQPVQVSPNLKLVSLASMLERDDSAVVWRGPMKNKAIRQFLEEVRWGELDWLICDSPPGTGDEPLTVAQLIPATGAVIVTTPQDVALLDSRKAISFARMLGLNILGIVENMSGLACPHCSRHIPLFKSGGGEKISRGYDVPLLGEIPIEPAIVESGDNGRPFMGPGGGSPARSAFESIAAKLMEDSK